MYMENHYDPSRNTRTCTNKFSPFFTIWEKTTCQDVVQDLHFRKSNGGVPASSMRILVKQLVSNATMHLFKSILFVRIHRTMVQYVIYLKKACTYTYFGYINIYKLLHSRIQAIGEVCKGTFLCFQTSIIKEIRMVGWQVSEESGHYQYMSSMGQKL